MRTLTPTSRTAAGLAGLALSALVIPAWVGVAGALMLAASAFLDAWSVRRPPAVQRTVPAIISRGVPVELTVTVQPGDRREVLLRQPPGPGLWVERGAGRGQLLSSLTGVRRGRHRLPGVAIASVGPLGLARIHHRNGSDDELRVYPDLRAARRLILRLRRSMAGLAGGAARGPLGLGTEFESVREYSPDDDVRQLNWRATARLGRPMSNQYRVERDREVVSLVDCGRLTAAPLGERTVLDASLDVLTVIALASDELGDRFGAVAFDSENRIVLTPRRLGGGLAIGALFDLQSRSVDSNFELAFARVTRSRRALVFVHTDLIDEAAARSLLAAVQVISRRHAVVVASAADPMLERMAYEDGDPARAVVALDVLASRRQAVAGLRRAGAQVLEAPAEQLAGRCLDAYVRAKLRGGL